MVYDKEENGIPGYMRQIAEEVVILWLQFAYILRAYSQKMNASSWKFVDSMINYQTCQESVSGSPRTIRVALILHELECQDE